MTLTELFWGIGDALTVLLSVLDENVGFTAFFNTSLILLGFFGLFYWLRHQIKYNKQAENNPNQLK